MAKRLTVVLDDEELYAAVTAEAARLNRPLKDVVAEALREWLEALEDAELIPLVEEARAEWEKHGGSEASELFRHLDGKAKTPAIGVWGRNRAAARFFTETGEGTYAPRWRS